jgi:hypothetical protein
VCQNFGKQEIVDTIGMPKFFFFLKDRQLYRQEISLKVVFQILQLVISSEMVCLNILEGGVFMYVCLVSPTHGS